MARIDMIGKAGDRAVMAMRKKRILLLSEGFGSGHTQAAQAIAVGLRLLSKQVVTRVIELGSFQHPTIMPLIFTAYRKTLATRPNLYGMLYRSRKEYPLGPVTKLALHRLFYASTASIIKQLKPDAVVCTHPFPALVVSRLKRSGYPLPLIGVITDYDAHASWVEEKIDLYLVSTPLVKKKLAEKGIPEKRIQVTGIPVHPKFWTVQDKDAIRQQFGLREMPTVLVMGGGWGLIENDEVMEATISWRDRVQLIYCLGSNEKALQRYSSDERYLHPNVHLLGYTKDIDKLMEVSDLLITKPGGMTCTEGISKGIPMLFYRPIPGQEEDNCRYFTENGFGEKIDSPDMLWKKLRQLADGYPEEDELRRIRRENAGLYGGRNVPQAILELLQWGDSQ